jgi:D-3-phosphoglycerate dehydrogenase
VLYVREDKNMTTQISIVDSSFMNRMFDALVPKLAGMGHRSTRYRDHQALFSDQEAWRTTDILLCMGSVPCTAAAMDRAPNLKAVISCVTGTEAIDVRAATQRTIVVGNGQTEKNYQAMAESTVLLILAGLYELNKAQHLLRTSAPRPAQLTARMLRGRTLGLIGLGRIAREIAHLLETWSVDIVAYAPHTAQSGYPSGVRKVELEELLRISDVVSLHASLNDQTRNLLNAERLAMMKPGAVVVNTARGAMIDDHALVDAVERGHISAVALDTFTIEPLPPDSPLRNIEHAVLTPHMIGHTAEADASLAEAALENLTRVCRGALPFYVCNPEVGGAWMTKWGAVRPENAVS